VRVNVPDPSAMNSRSYRLAITRDAAVINGVNSESGVVVAVGTSDCVLMSLMRQRSTVAIG
jgi:hypothetical protein